MYIEKKSVFDIPKDAIVMSEGEVLRHYQDKIEKWKNRRDVWPFTWSVPILSAVSFAANYSLISYYRNRVKLGDRGKVGFYLIAGTLPSFTVGFIHNAFVTPNVLLQRECRDCLRLKAATIQAGFFLGYSCIATPALAFLTGVSRGTYPIPGFSSKIELKGSWELYMKFTNRIVPRIILLTILNAAVACYLTSEQYSSFDFVNEKLYEKELELQKRVRELNAEMRMKKSSES